MWGLIAPGSVGGLLQRVSDFVFGYDYFISYKQDDGKNLPERLAARLTEAGYRVFLDMTGYKAGDDLKQGTERRVRMSAYTLLIARPGALTRSDWVVEEISACLAARKTPVIIDIDQAFRTTQGRDDDQRRRLASLRELLADRLRIEETGDGATGSPFDGEPSETLIDELRRSFRGWRQDTWRARVFGVAALVFAELAGAAVLFAINATGARLEAEEQARRARSGELAARARLIETLHPQAAGLLAAEAAKVTESAGDPLPNDSFQAMLETVVGLSGRGLPPLGGELRTLAAAPGGDQFVTGDDQGSAWLWRIEGDDASPIRLDNAGSLNVSNAAFGAHAHWLMTSGDGGDGCLWALPVGPAPACHALAPFQGAVFLHPTISPDGRWLAAAENKSAVWLWDLSRAAGTIEARQIGQSVEAARDTAFSPNSRWLAVRGVSTREIAFWDLDDPLAKMQKLSSPGSEIDALDLRDEPAALAAADNHGAVYLWSLLQPEQPAKMLNAASQDSVPAALRFNSAGNRLAVALALQGKPTTTILIWRLGRQDVAPRRVDVKHQVRQLDFDPMGRFLYIEGMNGELALLDLASDTDADPVSLPGHSAAVTQHVFSRDGKRLVTGDNEGRVSFWDLSCPDGLTSPIALRGLEEPVEGLTLDPAHERWLAGASMDGTARLWDFTLPVPGDKLAIARACAGLDQFAASPDRHWLAAANKAGDILALDLSAADPIASAVKVAEGLGPLQSMSFEPNGRWIAATTEDSAINLWDLSAPAPRASRRRIPAHHATETTVAPFVSTDFAADVPRMASTDSADIAWVTDYSETPPRSRLLPGVIREIWISPDGRWVAGADYDTVHLWDLAASGDKGPSEPAGPEAGIVALHFGRDSKSFTILDKSNNFRTWKLGPEGASPTRSFATVESDDNFARNYQLQFSRDERWMALTATNAPHIVVYDMSANPPRRIVPHGAPEMNGAPTFSDDGRWLAYATDKSVELWLTARLDQAPWVLGSPSRVLSLAFSSDGGKLTFGTERGELSLASLADDRPTLLANMKAQQGSIQLVAFSQDGGQAFSVSYQEARLWPLKPDRLRELLASRVGRDLSALEWSAYFPGEAFRPTFPAPVASPAPARR